MIRKSDTNGLIKTLKFSNNDLQMNAVDALGKIGDDRPIEALFEELMKLQNFWVYYAVSTDLSVGL